MQMRCNDYSIGIHSLIFGLVLGIAVNGLTGVSVQAALLDGLFDGFEESMAKSAEEKGEKLVIGNFYPAESPDSHGPMGTMGEHTHNEGEFMFTYKYMFMDMDGMRNGTDDLSSSDVLEDFFVTPTEMTMEMHMFGFMYGLNNTVTLAMMIPYVLNEMDHVNRLGGKFTTRSSGFGDIRMGALIRLYAFETPSIGSHRFHFNAGISIPTGDIKATDTVPTPGGPMTTRLPYPMQLGSGTVDLHPGLTYAGSKGPASWGFQAMGIIRIDENNQGYKRGSEYTLNTYGAYRYADWISSSLRLKWRDWANWSGRDTNINQASPAPGVPLVPTAFVNNLGGERLELFLGTNVLAPEVLGYEHHFNVEMGRTIYQDLNGPQLELDWTFFVGWQIVK